MTDLTRASGLTYISWNDWVAMGQQRSAIGFLAEWLETSPRPSKFMLQPGQALEILQDVIPGILACCPDVQLGRLSETVSKAKGGASVLALFPEEKLAEDLIDRVDPSAADLCLVLWPGLEDLELWLQANNATVLPSGLPTNDEFLSRIPMVARAALPDSKSTMDTLGDLRNGSGKDEIVQILQLLHEHGALPQPRDLALYGYQLGLRKREVDCIRDYADRILHGRRIGTRSQRLRADAYRRWMAAVEKLDT